LASYSLYQLLYGREPILLNSTREKLAPVVDLDDPNIWAECLQERTHFLPEGHAYGHGEFVHCSAP
jgi:hypothetical protein